MIDFTKPVQTKDGREVVIHTTKGVSTQYPIVGEYRTWDGRWLREAWTSSGTYGMSGKETIMDLINVPEKRVMYVNVYDPAIWGCHNSREDADQKALEGRLACVRVEYTEGQLDD